ncbi:MAG TPA: hypothetical protein VGD37_21080 [Kofleriaceae bacterium]|jgi:hypothetical protein
MSESEIEIDEFGFGRDPNIIESGTDELSLPPVVNLLVLLKAGREDHMNALRDGKLFCRRLSYYSEFEGDPAPHQDAHEGLACVYQSDRIKVTFTPADGGKPIALSARNGLVGPVFVSVRHENPVFCLHAVHTGDWTHRTFGDDELAAFKASLQVPASMDKFGSHVWVITNGLEFNRRLRAACAAQKIRCRGKLVRYVDPRRIHGTVPRGARGFVKLDSFAEEREYRFSFEAARELGDPFVLDVGSLHDVSEVTTLAAFRSGWSIDFE